MSESVRTANGPRAAGLVSNELPVANASEQQPFGRSAGNPEPGVCSADALAAAIGWEADRQHTARIRPVQLSLKWPTAPMPYTSTISLICTIGVMSV